MATSTPKIGLLKPVPNVELDWAFRLNETIDILDDTMLTTNVSGVGSITVTDDGSGNVTISGSATGGGGSNALVGADGITVISGVPTSSETTISGFRDEFLAASGTFLTNVVEDLTPQLGGDLDGDGKSITNVVDILSDGTVSGTNLKAGGDVTITGGRILSDDGSLTLPSYGFTGDPNAGLFLVTNGFVAMSIGGVNIMQWAQGSVTFDNGTALFKRVTGPTSPAIQWANDFDTGIYRDAANTVAFTTGGTKAGEFDANQSLHVTKEVIASGLQLTNLPTSSGSLQPGQVWVDVSADYTLKITP